jgi:hypothetical protein
MQTRGMGIDCQRVANGGTVCGGVATLGKIRCNGIVLIAKQGEWRG